MKKKEHKGKAQSSRSESPKPYLGDFRIPSIVFDDVAHIIKELSAKSFKILNNSQKSERVNRHLLNLIQKAKTPCFLLPAVLDYIDRVNALEIFESYTFLHFELWLNQFSGIAEEENLFIRGKITGKWIPRDAYQVIFPIGMGRSYSGSHCVTAHGSPDLDTTVASFWGWMDAFSARVAKRQHIWNVPGAPPESQTEVQILFHHIFGERVFRHLAKTRTTLGLSAFDLMTQQGMERKGLQESLFDIDYPSDKNAIVLVDEQGYYLGDWHSFDVEGVREVIALLNSCLRWFQSHLHIKLVSLFSKEQVSVRDLPAFFDRILSTEIRECDPAKELSHTQKKYLDSYLKKVLNITKGINSTFEELATGMKNLNLFEFKEFIDLLEACPHSSIFDRSGVLIENRPQLFLLIEKIVIGLQQAIQSIRSYVERFDIALKIKMHVFGHYPQSVSARAEVEEIRSVMNNYTYLTVTTTDEKGNLIPLGIIHAADLHKNTLGTVTLRDFCNREETKIPSYFEVISVIDHHKSHLQTNSAAMVLISDSQSSNVLCAELAFQINDQFSTGNINPRQIKEQVRDCHNDLTTHPKMRVLQRLLQRQLVSETKAHFFIDPIREYVEYLHFLYAILDDTDLLTKVSIRDLECVADILNRLKSLMLQQEVEIITLSDLPRDKAFTEKAARRILQHPDMYSLYRKIYLAREESMDQNIKLCASEKPFAFFIDTKEQNSCARVGQTKLFARNYPTFAKHAKSLKQHWYEASCAFYKGRQEVDLYLQMISTVAGAEDLYTGTEGNYAHRDEIWLWIPFSEQSIEHLKSFLNAFSTCPQVMNNQLSVSFYGSRAKEYDHIFTESFLSIPKEIIVDKGHPPIAIVHFLAGTINSRKAMITPYLPRVIE